MMRSGERDVYPKRTLKEILLFEKPHVYDTIEHTFYAVHMIVPPSIPKLSDIVIPTLLDIGDKDFTYFAITTSVGVGAKGQHNLNNVHIRFILMPMDNNIPEPEVILILPTNKSRIVGISKFISQVDSA
jgi:hypothetical protein